MCSAIAETKGKLMQYFITNFSTNEPIELFESIGEAEKFNYNNVIYKADIDENLIQKNEMDAIVYQDTEKLYLSIPIFVK